MRYDSIFIIISIFIVIIVMVNIALPFAPSPSPFPFSFPLSVSIYVPFLRAFHVSDMAALVDDELVRAHGSLNRFLMDFFDRNHPFHKVCTRLDLLHFTRDKSRWDYWVCVCRFVFFMDSFSLLTHLASRLPHPSHSPHPFNSSHPSHSSP